MFCSLTVFQLGKKTVTAKLQICRNYNDRYHAAAEPHKQQDRLRAHFVCFLCIRKIKGLRAEQILESGSKTMLLSAAGLSFTNCSLVLHHCPLGFGAKTTLVDRIWQKTNKQAKKHKQANTIFWLSSVMTVSRADGRVYGGLQVWKTHSLGRNKECWLHQNGRRTEGMECLWRRHQIEKGRNKFCPALQVGVSCACVWERVKETLEVL